MHSTPIGEFLPPTASVQTRTVPTAAWIRSSCYAEMERVGVRAGLPKLPELLQQQLQHIIGNTDVGDLGGANGVHMADAQAWGKALDLLVVRDVGKCAGVLNVTFPLLFYLRARYHVFVELGLVAETRSALQLEQRL